MKLSSNYFENLWRIKLSDFARELIDSLELECSPIDHYHEKELIDEMNHELTEGKFVRAGIERLSIWESGWRENYNEYLETRNRISLLPKYFGKSPINRLNQRLVIGLGENFEVRMLRAVQSWIFTSYFAEIETVYEYGCGTGHNLLYLHDLFPNIELVGLDWSTSSQDLIRKISDTEKITNLRGFGFDFFNPDYSLRLVDNAAVLTVASLEQIGEAHERFIDYLIKQGPRVIVNIEPFSEFLNPQNDLDAQSINYMHKRNYVRGFIQRVKSLEAEGKVEILCQKRSYVGSKYIEGYSILVWKVL